MAGRLGRNAALLVVLVAAIAVGTAFVKGDQTARNPLLLAGVVLVAIAGIAAKLTESRFTEQLARQRADTEAMQRCCLGASGDGLPAVAAMADPVLLGVRPLSGDEGPSALTEFIRRRSDEQLRAALVACEFVLVVGPSGAGKTRSAFEAMQDTPYLKHRLLVPASEGCDLSTDLVRWLAGLGPTILWLDNLETQLRPGVVSPSLLRQVLAASTIGRNATIVLATVRDTEFAVLRDRAQREGGDLRVVISQATIVSMAPFDSQELASAAASGDPRLARAAQRAPDGRVTEYLVDGPQQVERLRAAWSTQPAGAAFVTAAIDCRRAGWIGPLPETLLRALAPRYLADRANVAGSVDLEAGLAWATDGATATAMLMPSRRAGVAASYDVFDYLVDHFQRVSGAVAVPPYVWDGVIEHGDIDTLLSVAAAAQRSGVVENAVRAWERAIAKGSAEALRELGQHALDSGDAAAAERLWRRAGTMALPSLTRLLVAQGRTDDARQEIAGPARTGEAGALDALAELSPQPERAAGGAVTELRLDGVAGTPADRLLDAAARRVAGFAGDGFYRPKQVDCCEPDPTRAVEAHQWGIPGRNALARAGWLLLLPFTLLGLAWWMRPPMGPFPARLARAVWHLLAVAATAMFALLWTGIAIDLFAWQCAGTASCMPGRWLAGAMPGSWAQGAGHRMAVLAAVPLAAIGVLWWLSRRTWARYDSFSVASPVDGDGLASGWFWSGRSQGERLREVHVAVALSTMDALLAAIVSRHSGGTATVRHAATVLLAASLAVLVLAAVVGFSRAVTNRMHASLAAGALCRLLRRVSIAATVGVVWVCAATGSGWRSHGPLPGYAQTVSGLFAAQLIGILVLSGITVLGGHGWLAPRLTAAIVTAGACVLAFVLSAAGYTLTAWLLPAGNGDPGWRVPAGYAWANLMVLPLFVIVATLVLAWPVVARRLVRRARPDTDEDFPRGRERDPWRSRTIDQANAAGRGTEPVALMALMGTIAISVPAGFVALRAYRDGPTAGLPSPLAAVSTAAGSIVAVALPLALVLAGAYAYRRPWLRATAGLLWDFTTFWPRAIHPFGAPCYAEQIVPHVARRASWLASAGGVVLTAAHGGNLLATAVLLQVPQQIKNRIALVTLGSPLLRVYSRLFPNYVTEAVMEGLVPAGGRERWINLWRRTDPIGGPVGVGFDIRLADPTGFDPPAGDMLAPPIYGDLAYRDSAPYDDTVESLRAELRG